MPGLPLARYLLVAYALLITYASLYPFARWANRGANPFTYLFGALPPHFTGFDVAVNIVGYLPIGCLWVLAARPTSRRWVSIVWATLASAALSVVLEASQSYLPDRVASNLDLALNALGGLLGALLGAVWAPHAHASQSLLIGRHHWFRAGSRVDMGLVVLGLWLFAQLTPTAMLFGLGGGFGPSQAVPLEPLPVDVYVRVEAVSCAMQLVAVGLFIGTLIRTGRSPWLAVLVIVALGLLVRTASFATLFAPKNAFSWATPGALQGVVIGLAVLLLQRFLDERTRVVLAVLMLVATTVVVNFAPGNPYTSHSLLVWRQGHFLNFHGLTSFVTTIWPIVALTYLIGALVRRRSRDRGDDPTRGDQTR